MEWEFLGLFWLGMGLKMFFRSYPLKHVSTQSSKTSLEIFFFDLWWKRYKSIKMFCTVFFSLSLFLSDQSSQLLVWNLRFAVWINENHRNHHLPWFDFLSVLRRVISQALDEQPHSHALHFSQVEVGVLIAPVGYVLWFSWAHLHRCIMGLWRNHQDCPSLLLTLRRDKRKTE